MDLTDDVESTSLTELLDNIQDGVNPDKEKLTLDNVRRLLKRQGFGAMLLAPAAVLLLPTGAIPGVPVACAVFICLVAGQIVLGREEVWIPKRLRKVTVSRKKFVRGLRRAKPIAEKIDDVVQPRFEFLTNDITHRLAAAICIALSLPMIFIGFIPFVPMLLALPILFFALAMCVRDGFLMLCGFAVVISLIAAVPCLAGLCF
jgi:hypothetical protein